MSRTILITGGAGFVGSNLAVRLKQACPEDTIIAFDNLKRRGSELNLPRFHKAGVIFVHGDIRNKEDLEALPKYDHMIECSAEPSVMAGLDSSPSYLLNTNLLGTINCLESVRKHDAKLIFLSTSRVYPIEAINDLHTFESETRFELADTQEVSGVSAKGIAEDFTLSGARSLYGATKLASELLIEEYAAAYGVPAIINRCGVITGPWQMGKADQGVIVLWVARHIFDGKLSYIGYNGSGKQVRDFLHVDDLFEALNIQLDNFNTYTAQTFNLGGGKAMSTSLRELTAMCQKVTGKTIAIESVGENRQADIKLYITDSSKFEALSAWKAKKDLETTVTDIANWITENKTELGRILS